MSKTDIVTGHATFEDFMYWMEERHRIWIKRSRGVAPPWTDDPVLHKYRFTNVFRELDKGTVVLRSKLDDAIADHASFSDILFNVVWYRFWNHYENMIGYPGVGFVTDFDQLKDGMRKRHDAGLKIFTSSHMTTGRPGEDKIDTYLDASLAVWNDKDKLADEIEEDGTLAGSFQLLRKYDLIGPFVAYEMVSDLRWTPLLSGAPDKLTWANLGPGCKRGLTRLGMPLELASLVKLYARVASDCSDPYQEKLMDNPLSPHFKSEWPPFELREIEHSLCEMDKYQRAKTDAGRPRENYNYGKLNPPSS